MAKDGENGTGRKLVWWILGTMGAIMLALIGVLQAGLLFWASHVEQTTRELSEHIPRIAAHDAQLKGYDDWRAAMELRVTAQDATAMGVKDLVRLEAQSIRTQLSVLESNLSVRIAKLEAYNEKESTP